MNVFRLMERDQCWSDLDWGSWLDSVFALFVEDLPTGFSMAVLHLWPQTHTIKLLDARIGHLKEHNQCLPSHRFSCEAYDVCEHHYQVAPIDLKHEKHFQEQKQLDPITSRAGNPSNLSPVSNETISDSVELWATEVCFLHIQLTGRNV